MDYSVKVLTLAAEAEHSPPHFAPVVECPYSTHIVLRTVVPD